MPSNSPMMVTGIYKHRVYCYFGDQVSIATRYLRVDSTTGGGATELQFVTSLDTTLAALYKPAMANGAQYVGSNVQLYQGGPPYNVPTGYQGNLGVGTGGAQPLPAQVSGIYTTLTTLTGPGYRGRSYVPFPPAAASTTTAPPVMQTAYGTLLIAIANSTTYPLNVTTAGGTVGITWGLFRNRGAVTGWLFTPLAGWRVGINWATQKRRGDFGRTNAFPTP